MGCDGGTIPRRDELVRTKKKPEKVDRDIENAAKWKYCALTQAALREPVAVCYLGRLYNKEAVIEALLDKTIAENENAGHIRNMKDIKTLNLTKNPSFDTSQVDKGNEYKDYNVAQFICPVVGLEMNGKHRFCVVWSCGCVMSERALKEVKSEVCHKCGKSYQQDDVIILYGNDDELEQLRSRHEQRREAKQSSTSNKSSKKQHVQSADDKPSTSGVKTASSSSVVVIDKKIKLEPGSSSSAATNGGNAAMKSAVMSGGKRKEGGGAGVDGSTTADAKKQKTTTTTTTTIQKDPNASKVFKSLFTTSEAAKSQPRAHWVTYNPLYY